MSVRARISVMNIHWGFSFGGISQYATTIESVSRYAPIEMTTVCIISAKKHVDERSISKLGKLVIIERAGLFDMRWVGQLVDVVETNQPSLILTHAFNGHFAAFVLKRKTHKNLKFIASFHGKYHPSALVKRLMSGFYNFFAEWYLRCIASCVVTVAECGKAYLISRGVTAGKITVIHNGIPDITDPPVSREVLRKEIGVPDSAIVVGVVSRLEPIKGIDYLLRAFKLILHEFADAYLVVIGSGVQEPYLKALVRELDIHNNVVFAGYRSDAAKYYFALDIFALPSLSEFHSIGLLEAMRASCAIVATDVGGNTESVSHEKEGLIIKSASVDELVDALRQLYSSPELRMRLGMAARKRFKEEFTQDTMINRSADFFMQAASDRPSGQ